MAAEKHAGKILILATESCAYPGADAVGQGHQSYPANTYILRVKAPVLFPGVILSGLLRQGHRRHHHHVVRGGVSLPRGL